MRCPFCIHIESKVTDSRTSTAGDVIRRRRECDSCGRRFTTYERVEDVLPAVVKKDGRREAYDRQKLLAGVRRACEKRPVSLEAMERMIDSVEREIIDVGEREVPTVIIGEKVMLALRGADEIAYVRFASVYRSFRDLAEFYEELESLKARPAPAAKETIV